MGVERYKDFDGVRTHCLRFSVVLEPINLYIRKLRGDSSMLPQASLLTLMILREDEVAWTDSEDLESCFNLFYLPEAWLGMFAFSLPVPACVFGGDPNVMTYAALRSVPMGWINSVNVIQHFIRKIVFNVCGAPAELEIHKLKSRPTRNAAVVCMDGFDFVKQEKLLRDLVPQIDILSVN